MMTKGHGSLGGGQRWDGPFYYNTKRIPLETSITSNGTLSRITRHYLSPFYLERKTVFLGDGISGTNIGQPGHKGSCFDSRLC